MSNNLLTQDLLNIYGKFMLLKIFIDSDDNELKNKYIETINERQQKMIDNINHIDAGFDLVILFFLRWQQAEAGLELRAPQPAHVAKCANEGLWRNSGKSVP